MYKEKEMAQLMETERKRAVKPSLRYLPEAERNELLNVSAQPIYFKYLIFIFISVSFLLIVCVCVCVCVCITKLTVFVDLYIHVFHSGTED